MCKECGCGATENKQDVLSVPGMMCENCKKTVEGALLKVSGVMSAEVNLEDKTVAVNYKSDAANTEQLVSAITGVGFDVDTNATITTTGVHAHTHKGFLGTVKKLFQ